MSVPENAVEEKLSRNLDRISAVIEDRLESAGSDLIIMFNGQLAPNNIDLRLGHTTLILANTLNHHRTGVTIECMKSECRFHTAVIVPEYMPMPQVNVYEPG